MQYKSSSFNSSGSVYFYILFIYNLKFNYFWNLYHITSDFLGVNNSDSSMNYDNKLYFILIEIIYHIQIIQLFIIELIKN